jgi:hypothetical protein
MGFAKRMMEEAEGRGFWPSGDTICRSHVVNGFLAGRLAEGRSGSLCIVCGRSEASPVDLDELCDCVFDVIWHYRRRAIDELFLDPETESRYALPDRFVALTAEVLVDLFDGALDDELLEHLASVFEPEYWFDPGVLWFEGAELHLESWSGFRALARANQPGLDPLLVGQFDDPAWSHEAADGFRPSQVLGQVLSVIDELDVVTEFPMETEWFRAVHVPIGEDVTAGRLGTAPAACSSENRMNRTGEPMFYGAADTATVLAEIGPAPAGQRTLVSVWTPPRPLRVLELVKGKGRQLPDLYDLEQAGTRWRLQFLAGFADDVSQRVDPDKRIEYRATQLLMEYLRSRVTGLDGIIYRSSHSSEPCCALDVDNARCIAPDAIASVRGELYLVLNSWDPLGP